MLLRLTVAGPVPGRPEVDVEVSASPGTTLSEVREELHRAAGVTAAPGPVYVGQTALGPSAVLGEAPLTEGALLHVGWPAPAVLGAAGLLELWVVGGPDAGGVFRLGPGATRIGRDVDADIPIDDPDLSRLHAVVTVSADGVDIHDFDSTNGTLIDGQPISGEPAPLRVGALMRVGESTLTLIAPDDPPVAVHADRNGHLEVNRPPRLPPPLPQVEIGFPMEPMPPDNPRFPVLMLLIPLVIGAVMVKVMGSWMFAIFMLLSPLMLASNYISDRVGGRKGYRRARAGYQRASAGAQARIDTHIEAERALRRLAHPDPATLMLAAAGPRQRLWERRPTDDDALSVRLGTADLPARVTIRPDTPGELPWHPAITDVPVTVPLREVGVLGLAGPAAHVAGLARHVVAQLAALHSPRDLDLVVLCDHAGDAASRWQWARWLPHLAATAGEDCSLLVGLDPEQINVRVAELVAALDARIAVLQGSASRGWAGRSTVLVLDGARALRAVPGVARLLEHGRHVGIYAVCLSTDPLELPQECGATGVITGEVNTRLQVNSTGHPPVVDAVADLVSGAWAQQFARALAALRDATPEGGHAALPASARLVDLLALDPPTAEVIAAGWQAGGGSTTALLGVAADGPFSIDLRMDGPHGLVAGTTGAGKSELLQTLVGSLALGNRPDQMTFVLVDYKGGSAFKDCARLPHTVGMVTDLDGHLTERALSSLDAELKRREHLLNDADCKDIEDYVLAGSPSGPLPRLVMVIDEFASLVQELPDFVTGLVDIARRGRSLGVHLILATQRPGGVVSADIRANTNLRIALRVTDPTESQDVIESKDAALISRSTPGRAVCRTGAGGVVAFQSARVGGRPVREGVIAPSVRQLRWSEAGDPPPRPPAPADDDVPTDLALLVEAMRAAAAATGISAPASPWLPPLAAVVVVQDLAPTGPETIPLGLIDLPAQQARATFELDLAHGGHLMAVGGPRSGRTTLLRTLAGSVALHCDPLDVHLYALDCAGGGLAPVAALPHAGAVVARDDIERGDRLISRLAAEVSRRQQILGRHGFGSLAEQRAGAPTDQRLPWLLLLLDGWEGFLSAYDVVDAGRSVETMLRLLREGPGVGLRAVVAGDRSALTGRVSSLMANRIVLRMPDDMDYALAGLCPRQIPDALRPGQGLLPGDVVIEAQVALLASDPAGPAQVAELTRLAQMATERTAVLTESKQPFRVDALPERVSYDSVVASIADPPGPLWTPIGVGGDDLWVAGIDLAEEGPAFVIAGPARSGRSTALVAIARWHVDRGTAVLAVAPRRSPLRDVDGLIGVYGSDEVDILRDAIAAVSGPMVVLADDADGLLDTPVGDELCEILRQAPDRAWAVIIAGSTEEMSASYRGITADARRHKVGLLLSPSGPVDGDVLGVRLSRSIDPRPGRGVLCIRGASMLVQVAQAGARLPALAAPA